VVGVVRLYDYALCLCKRTVLAAVSYVHVLTAAGTSCAAVSLLCCISSSLRCQAAQLHSAQYNHIFRNCAITANATAMLYHRDTVLKCAQVAAEYEKRRENFFKEFDFVLADILTSCFANFAAVWSSCPTMTVAGAAADGAVAAAGSTG
jgi:Protein RETICULATA-related